MTAICPAGGPSAAKAGFGAAVVASTAALAAKFANTASWLSAFIAAYLATIDYDLVSFCTTDPPATPTLTAADFVALTSILDPVARTQAQLKIQQWIGSFLWYDFCECTGGGTPSPPSIPGPPSGLPTVDPPSVFLPPTVQPCRVVNGGPLTVSTGPGTFFLAGVDWPFVDATSFRFTLTNAVGASPGVPVTWDLLFDDEIGGATLRTIHLAPATPGVSTGTTYIQPGSRECIPKITVGVGTGTTVCTWKLEVFCNGNAPGAPVAPCCPPDPALAGQIDQILKLVTLIQRQAAPFGYVPGAVHAGLTGHGSFAVSGILGVKLELTTTNLSGGLRDGSPQELFDQGFVTLGTADGYEHSRRIDHVGELVLPIAAGAFTTVGYTLEVGVVATITELLREP